VSGKQISQSVLLAMAWMTVSEQKLSVELAVTLVMISAIS
jgi:hypothetical protein